MEGCSILVFACIIIYTCFSYDSSCYCCTYRDVGLLHSEGWVSACRGGVVRASSVLGWLRLYVIDGRRAGGCVASIWMVHDVISMGKDLRADQQRFQILDVGAGQFQCVDLGQFPCGGVSRNQLAELIECWVDCVHSLPFTLVGRGSLPTVQVWLDQGVGFRVLVAALVRARTARTAASRAPVVRCMAMLACGLVSSLAVGSLRGRRLAVVIVDVIRAREAAAFSLYAWGPGGIAQRLHRRAHGCF